MNILIGSNRHGLIKHSVPRHELFMGPLFAFILVTLALQAKVLALFMIDYKNLSRQPTFNSALFDFTMAKSAGPIALGAYDNDSKTKDYLNYLARFADSKQKRFELQGQVAKDLLAMMKNRASGPLNPEQAKAVREAADKINIATAVMGAVGARRLSSETAALAALGSMTSADFIKNYCTDQKHYLTKLMDVETQSIKLLQNKELLEKIKHKEKWYKKTLSNLLSYQKLLLDAIKQSDDNAFVWSEDMANIDRDNYEYVEQHLQHEVQERPSKFLSPIPGKIWRSVVNATKAAKEKLSKSIADRVMPSMR